MEPGLPYVKLPLFFSVGVVLSRIQVWLWTRKFLGSCFSQRSPPAS